MAEIFLIQKIKKLRDQVFRQHFSSLWWESSPAVILQCQKKQQLVESIPFSWNVHRIQYILKEWGNKTVIFKYWLLTTGTFSFSALLYYFPTHFIQKPSRSKGSCVFGQRSGSNHNTLSFVTTFWDYNFQQTRVLNLVWRMKGKLDGPRKYYHKPLLTIFLHFKWSLNYGITRHHAKNPILFEQSHYLTFCFLWFS